MSLSCFFIHISRFRVAASAMAFTLSLRLASALSLLFASTFAAPLAPRCKSLIDLHFMDHTLTLRKLFLPTSTTISHSLSSLRLQHTVPATAMALQKARN